MSESRDQDSGDCPACHDLYGAGVSVNEITTKISSPFLQDTIVFGFYFEDYVFHVTSVMSTQNSFPRCPS